MKKNKVLGIAIIILIMILMIVSIKFTDYKLQNVFLKNEAIARKNIAIETLPNAKELVSYSQELLIGVSNCYIETKGLGMVTETNVSAQNIKIDIFVGVNHKGYISGVIVTGDEFENTFVEDLIDDEYLSAYIGVNEITEESIKQDARFEYQKSTDEIAESIYQTVKLALRQYGEIYE